MAFYTSQLGSWDNFIYRPGSDYSDLTITFWPNIYYIQQSIHNFHQIPFWRTLIFSGSPFDSDPQSGLWYPLNLVFLFFSAVRGFNLLFLFHFVLAGLGMWIWAKEYHLSRWGSAISVIAGVFMPKALAHLGFGHVGLYYGYAYVPWILWAAELAGRGSSKHIHYLGIAFGLQCIVSPQLAIYTAMIGFTNSLVKMIWMPGTHQTNYLVFQSIVKLLTGFGLGLILSAAQTLPELRFAALSGRQGLGVEDTAISALPLRYLLGFLIADHGGYMEYMLYAGLPTLVLAGCALLSKKHRYLWLFVALSLIYAMGTQTPFYSVIYHLTPFVAWLRSPGRIMLVGMVILALLAGVGFDQIFGEVPLKTRKWINMVLAGLGFGAVLFVIGYIILVGRPAANIIAFGIITPATALIIGLIQNKKIASRVASGLIFGLLLIDLWVVDGTLIEGRDERYVFKDRALGEYFSNRKDGGLFRIYSPSYSLPRQIGAYYQLESADGVDPLYLADYDIFMQSASGVRRTRYDVTIPAMEGGGEVAMLNREAIPNLKLLGILNVRYLVTGFPLNLAGLSKLDKINHTYIYENEFCLPRAYVVGKVIPVSNLSATLHQATNVDLSQTALVEKGTPLADVSSPQAIIHWMKYSPNQALIGVKTDRSVFLVLSQVYHPDWRVYVDGQRGTLYKTNGVVSGLYIQTGEHIIELVYTPMVTYLGLTISALTALIAAAIMIYRMDRHKE